MATKNDNHHDGHLNGTVLMVVCVSRASAHGNLTVQTAAAAAAADVILHYTINDRNKRLMEKFNEQATRQQLDRIDSYHTANI